MRYRCNILCFLGFHRFSIIKEHWSKVKETPDIEALVRFEECEICGKTKATLTHPFKDITCYASPEVNDYRYGIENK